MASIRAARSERLLSSTTLKENNICFRADLAEPKRLPHHVKSLRNALLNFTGTIPQRLYIGSQEDNSILNTPKSFHTRSHQACISLEERQLIETQWKNEKSIREEALRLSNKNTLEGEWQHFFENNFFDPLAEQVKVSNNDDRRTAQAKFYYDYFESARSLPWSLFGQQQFKAEQRRRLTEPKPDLVLFFPIHGSDSSCNIPTSEAWNFNKAPKQEIVENFTRPVLEHLAKFGLESNVAGSRNFSNGLCFPWFIVEYKKDKRGENYCY
ncbi:hypothetical protein QBC38DRAFT_368180, partial [Podospora fimiseda]